MTQSLAGKSGSCVVSGANNNLGLSVSDQSVSRMVEFVSDDSVSLNSVSTMSLWKKKEGVSKL